MGMVTIDAKKVAWNMNREGQSVDFLIPHDGKAKDVEIHYGIFGNGVLLVRTVKVGAS
jgi:hypothetical protein